MIVAITSVITFIYSTYLFNEIMVIKKDWNKLFLNMLLFIKSILILINIYTSYNVLGILLILDSILFILNLFIWNRIEFIANVFIFATPYLYYLLPTKSFDIYIFTYYTTTFCIRDNL